MDPSKLYAILYPITPPLLVITVGAPQGVRTAIMCEGLPSLLFVGVISLQIRFIRDG